MSEIVHVSTEYQVDPARRASVGQAQQVVNTGTPAAYLMCQRIQLVALFKKFFKV